MSEHNDVSRMAGRVKVRWTDGGKQYGFIVSDELYEKFFHEDHAEYTTVNDVTQHVPVPVWRFENEKDLAEDAAGSE